MPSSEAEVTRQSCENRGRWTRTRTRTKFPSPISISYVPSPAPFPPITPFHLLPRMTQRGRAATKTSGLQPQRNAKAAKMGNANRTLMRANPERMCKVAGLFLPRISRSTRIFCFGLCPCNQCNPWLCSVLSREKKSVGKSLAKMCDFAL